MIKLLLFIAFVAFSIIKAHLQNKAKEQKRAQQTPTPSVFEVEEEETDTYTDEEYEEEAPQTYEPIMPQRQTQVELPTVAVKENEVEPEVTKPQYSDVVEKSDKIQTKLKEPLMEISDNEQTLDFDAEEMRRAVLYNAILTRPNY
jgi:hypothetical protein